MSIKVKPCPFCGGAVEVTEVFESIEQFSIKAFGFNCESCNIFVKVYPKEPYGDISREEAIKCYNRRCVSN